MFVELKEANKTFSDSTNRFFEARVAVMGFKCRTMQLQGELDEMVNHLSSEAMPFEQLVGVTWALGWFHLGTLGLEIGCRN